MMEACPTQLLLKNLLHNFVASTGLKVSYSKSVMVHVNITDGKLQELATPFDCQKGSLPFTYLGMPLGTTKPNIQDFMPLMQRIEKRFSCTSMFLSQDGKLELANSVFSSSTIYYTTTLKLHKGVIKQLDCCRKHFLWRGSDLTLKALQGCLAIGLLTQKNKEALESLISPLTMRPCCLNTFTNCFVKQTFHGSI
jgi:hypothetical protein